MAYRPATHPHRRTVVVPRALWQAVEAAADRELVDYSRVIRAALLAAEGAPAERGRPDGRVATTERHAIRLCSECIARVRAAMGPATQAGALRALLADGLTRDWRAQLRRAEMGDAWTEVAVGVPS